MGQKKKGKLRQFEQREARQQEPKRPKNALSANREEAGLDSAEILQDARLAHPANLRQRGELLQAGQQRLGNQAVQRLLQAKRTIGAPGDPYEREADRLAAKVLRMPDPALQRQEEEEEEELIQASPLPTTLQRQEEEEEEELLQASPLPTTLQRQEEEEEEEELIQAKEQRGPGGHTTPAQEALVDRAIQSSGQSLPASERAFFEPRLGGDLEEVRIHTGSEAAQAAQALRARAFTVERDIVFGLGQYSPQTAAGKELLAHELVHTVQQGEGIRRTPDSPYSEQQLRDFYTIVTNPTLLDARERPHVFSVYEKTGGDMSLPQLVDWMNETEDFGERGPSSAKYHVLTPGAARIMERFYPGLTEAGLTPLHGPNRFYSLYHLRSEYSTITEHGHYYESLLTEAERREHAEEQVGAAEEQLRPVFGERWPQVRELILRYLPTTTDLLTVNWKIKLAEPTVEVRSQVEPLVRLIRPGITTGHSLRLQRVKAESGIVIERGSDRPTIEIDLTRGTLLPAAIAMGNLKVEATLNVEWSGSAGPLAVGVKTSILNPLSSGVSWKIGYETKGDAVRLPHGYTTRSYLEFCLEGDLSNWGRAQLAAAYVVAAVGLAYAGAAILESAGAVGLATAGARLLQTLAPAAAAVAAAPA